MARRASRSKRPSSAVPRAIRRSAQLEGTLVVLGIIAGLTLGAHAVATLALKKAP